MPRISTFYGIIIYMYYMDHNPPHFHAVYAGYEAIISIETGKTIDGKLPLRAQSLVGEWCTEHRKELLENWTRCIEMKPLNKIEPLQ